MHTQRERVWASPLVRRSAIKRWLGHLYRSVLPGLCLPLDSGPPLPVHPPGTGAEKSGMRPMLEGDLNCTQKCLSYGNVPTTSSAAQTACSSPCFTSAWIPYSLFLPRNARFLFQVGCHLPPAQPLPGSVPGKQRGSGQLRSCHSGCRKVSCVTPVF
uniref:Uncharacterized protein n=1 Tax=Bos indicus x Bos taurus TaxID=30522 RepID=A0A4W2EF56_BOBOX